jgi:hypothetical protein
MKIEELTIGQVREIQALFPVGKAVEARLEQTANSHPFNIGGNYFLRTVTHHLTGKLREVHPQELVLSDAAWIADDGRFADAVAKSEFNEVEPFPKDRLVIVGRASLIDAVEIQKLPCSQK